MANIKRQINTKFKKFKIQNIPHTYLPDCINLPECFTQSSKQDLSDCV